MYGGTACHSIPRRAATDAGTRQAAILPGPNSARLNLVKLNLVKLNLVKLNLVKKT